jgi:hypothetical protein
MELDLTLVKQIITEIIGINGNLFRVSTRFLESKGRIYLSYKEKDAFEKKHCFCLNVKKGKLRFTAYSFRDEREDCSLEIDEKETLLRKSGKFSRNKENKFIQNLNKRIKE